MGVEETFLNIIKGIFYKPQQALFSMVKKLKAIPLRSSSGQGFPLLPILLNIVLEVLAIAIRQKKDIKGI